MSIIATLLTTITALLLLQNTISFPLIREETPTPQNCTLNTDCPSSNTCIKPLGTNCTTQPCFCIASSLIPSDFTNCTSDSDCKSNKCLLSSVCFPFLNVNVPGLNVSTNSDGAVSINSADQDGVCIGVHHLHGVERNDLVYETHRRAKVLCDGTGSCATDGHIVQWNGRVMMMSSYCDIVGGCTRTSMWVNSPKWRRGVRVKSHTQGLSFTSFAARYGTTWEESVLKTAVRVGL